MVTYPLLHITNTSPVLGVIWTYQSNQPGLSLYSGLSLSIGWYRLLCNLARCQCSPPRTHHFAPITPSQSSFKDTLDRLHEALSISYDRHRICYIAPIVTWLFLCCMSKCFPPVKMSLVALSVILFMKIRKNHFEFQYIFCGMNSLIVFFRSRNNSSSRLQYSG